MLRLLALRAPLAQHDSKGVGPGKRSTRHTERGALCPAQCSTSRSATTPLGEYFMLRLLALRAPLAQHDCKGVGPGKRSTRHTERGVLCPAQCSTSRSATTPLGEYFMLRLLALRAPLAQHDSTLRLCSMRFALCILLTAYSFPRSLFESSPSCLRTFLNPCGVIPAAAAAFPTFPFACSNSLA